jgi:siroheme synthase-like protein
MSGTSYPIVLTHLDRTRCVVVGGGPVAERKIAALLDGAALVTVVSPDLTTRLRAWVEAGRLEHIGRNYDAGDLDGAGLAIAATDDPVVNDEVARAARRRGILINVADNPSAGNFHTVATVREGDVLVAISTGGDSPALAALLRRRIDALVGPEYAELLEILRAVRASALREFPASVRRRLSQDLASEEMLEWLRSGKRSLAEAYVATRIDAARAAGLNDGHAPEPPGPGSD